MRSITPTILLLLLSATICRAQNTEPANSTLAFKPILGDIDLQDGDTLVFLGDSITHQCLYTQYVEDFFYTRYPDRRIKFHNAGVGGDRARDALIRFDDDVAKFNPKYVTILLGMNDGTYTTFKPDVFDTYQRDMTTLLNRLAESGAAAVPMTPTMFDSRAAMIRDKGRPGHELRDDYYNGVLAFYGAWLREQSFRRGLGFVDMYAPLNNLTTTQRKTEPTFTLIKDAVHPGPSGQVVMALAVLTDMHSNALVSAINATQRRLGWKVTARNGTVTDVAGGEDLSFTFTSYSLPWVLPEEAALGFKLSRAGQRRSRETLKVTGLPTGRYELKIDGQTVGQYTQQRLASQIALQLNAKTPQFQQALEVAMLNKERNDKAIRPLRGWWSQRKRRLNAIQRAQTDQERQEKQQEMETWLSEFHDNVERLLKLAQEYEDKIYEANQPKPRKYDLTRAA